MSSCFLFNATLLAPLHGTNVTYAGGMHAAVQEIIWSTPNGFKPYPQINTTPVYPDQNHTFTSCYSTTYLNMVQFTFQFCNPNFGPIYISVLQSKFFHLFKNRSTSSPLQYTYYIFLVGNII